MGILDFIKRDKKEDHETKEVNTIIIQEEERGTSGIEINAGYYDEEYLDTLTGTERAKEFDKMRRGDTQCKMLIKATVNPILSSKRIIKPAVADNPDYEKHAELCRQIIFEDINEKKFIKEATNFVIYGNSVFEKVHKINVGKQLIDKDGNVLMDSYIGLKKLAWRSPKTIETWNFNEEKELESVTQQAYGDLASSAVIPVEHLIIMTLDGDGDDYEGISMLRPCYGNVYRKNVYLKLNAIGIEKSFPIPVATAPQGKEKTAEFANMVNTLKRFVSHRINYIVKPVGWEIELSAGTQYDPDKVEKSINSEDMRMAKAFLANFLELGTGGNGGAYALSNDLSDFFLGGIVQLTEVIKEAVDQLMKELVILNFGEQDKYPTFEFVGIQDKAGKEFAEIMKLLVESRIIVPDDELESHVRDRYGVTDASEEGKREQVQGPQQTTLSEKMINSAIKARRKQLSEEK